jgi:hypothetical protein
LDSTPTPSPLLLKIKLNVRQFALVIITNLISHSFIVIGILGNIITIIVLIQPRMRSSINYLLIGLAVSDLLLLVAAILSFGLTAIYPHSGKMMTYYFNVRPFLTLFVFPLSLIAQMGSIYLTMFVSLERYIAIRFPLKARGWCTKSHAKQCLIAITIFAIVYNLPKFFEVGLTEGEDKEHGTFYCLRASNLRRNGLYISTYIHWMYLIFMNLIPLTAITFFNVEIFLRVRQVNKNRYKLTQREMQDIKLTSMLFCVVVVFLVCNFPAVLINILESFFQNIEIDDRLLKLSNFLVALSSSVNFIIYVVLVKKFRLVFLDQSRHFLLCGTVPQKYSQKPQFDRRFSRLDSVRYSVSHATDTSVISS